MGVKDSHVEELCLLKFVSEVKSVCSNWATELSQMPIS